MKKIFLLVLLCGTLLQAAWSRWYTQKLRDEFGDPNRVVAMVANGPNTFIGVTARGGNPGMFMRYGFNNMGSGPTIIRIKIDNNEILEIDAVANGRDVITARTPENAAIWDEMIDQMIAGRRFRAVAVDGYGKSRLIDAPLSGFTAAYNQIR